MLETFFRISCEGYRPRYNCAPGQQLAIIADKAPDHLTYMQWGFVHSHTSLRESKPMINARAEGIAQKPLFRKAFRNSRCLVPADSFYEWKQNGYKTPYRILLKNQEVFAMAGIYNPSEVNDCSFAVITRPANDFMKNIHHRMPLILQSHEDCMKWLNKIYADDDIEETFENGPEMEAYVVSTALNNARNDNAALHQPWNPPIQQELFN